MKVLFILVIMSTLFQGVVLAQGDSEKKPLFLYLGYYRTNDQPPRLKISTKTKVGRKFEIAEKVLVNVFLDEESGAGFIGQVRTNLWGESWLTIPKKLESKIEQSYPLNFIATSTSDSLYQDASQELEIYKAKIVLELSEKDSVRSIEATLLAWEDSVWNPIPEVEIRLVAKRMLKDIQVTEDEYYESDGDGHVSSEMSVQMPGDEEGNLIVGAKIVDHDAYGNIESTQLVNWGVARVKDDSFSHRSLWSTRAKTPWWLLVFPNLIITGVWGIIYYLIYLLFKIKKLGNLKESI